MELKVLIDNASYLAKHDPETFALIRRVGFGASDSSILLGVNPFPDNTLTNLIMEKQSNVVSARELAIGQMVNVRKGTDLEPIIMSKFEERFNREVTKPEAMYQIGDTPLTVNYDGVMAVTSSCSVPVECKFLSTYGAKYYNMSKQIMGDELPMVYDLEDLGDMVNGVYLTKRAAEAGIPIYYYTQIQQQMLGLNAPFGYLTALFDKDWELKTFLVMADEQVQKKLLEVAEDTWKMITPN